MEFDGTLICVFHDRYFVNKLAARILEFVGQDVFDFSGNYQDFLLYKKNIELSNPQKNLKLKSANRRKLFCRRVNRNQGIADSQRKFLMPKQKFRS